MKFIALLRGINVGGKNKLSMKELKSTMEQRGYTDVITYINSGNIIFKSSSSDIAIIKREFEAMLLNCFKLDVTTLIILADQLIEALQHAPVWWDADEASKHNAIFVIPPASTEDILHEVGDIKPEHETVHSYSNIIFWSAPIATFEQSRWSKLVSKSTSYRITIRNANTVKKLLELCKQG